MPEKKSSPRSFWLLILFIAFMASILLWAALPSHSPERASASSAVNHQRARSLSPRLFEVGPISPQGLLLQLTPTPEPQEMTLEDEYRANSETAVGIALGAVVLVLIVVIGTVSILSQKER